MNLATYPAIQEKTYWFKHDLRKMMKVKSDEPSAMI